MMRILFTVVLFLVSAIFNAYGKTVSTVNDSAKVENLSQGEKVSTASHPLEPLLKAIIQVESKGNPKAYNRNGDCVGLLQITPICVRECNNILKKKGSKKRYTYKDRWNAQKSIEMFYLLQDAHNPSHNINKGIRLWNGRASYKTRVLKIMQNQK